MERVRLPRSMTENLFGALLEKALSYAPTMDGRGTWRECWITMLASIVMLVVLLLLNDLIDAPGGNLAGFWMVILCLAPIASAQLRRLHDRGRSWLNFLVTALPYVGIAIFFFILAGPPQDGENEYGPDPRTRV